MGAIQNAALTEECILLISSILSDVNTPSKVEDDGGLSSLEPETLARLKSFAGEVLATNNTSIRNPDAEIKLLRRLDDEIEKTYRRFYDYVYANLPYRWRQLYTDLTLLKFSAVVFREGRCQDDGDHDEVVDSLVAMLDKAIILAGAAGRTRGRRSVDKLLEMIDEPCAKRPLPASFPSERPFVPPVTAPIRVVNSMSMAAFQSYLDSADPKLGPEPMILKSLITEWPAMTWRRWSDPRYLVSRAHNGRRLVPVEVGRSYVDDGWKQELVTFDDFIRRMIGLGSGLSESGGQPTTYLAQHELFSQMPVLQKDILTPDHCFTSPPPHPLDSSKNKPELDLPLVNAWIGPAGTITPLHTDGYHNLLCQVVGAKYVRLYAPSDSEAVCPRDTDEDGVDMSNTSAFDVGVIEAWDKDTEGRDPIELEEFRGLRHWDCVLEEGDVLYIPIGWWHYVRSLSASCSVSFWWNGNHHDGRGET